MDVLVDVLYLFGLFFKIGLFAIGGGLATLPFLFQIADGSGWFARETIGDMLAVGQSLPGAIGVNVCAYAGLLHTSGVTGAYAAALGLVAPSIIIILIVARTLQRFRQSAGVAAVFSGFRPAAAGLLSAACCATLALSLWNASAPAWYLHIRWKETLLFVLLFALIIKFKKHPVAYVVAAALAGVVFKL